MTTPTPTSDPLTAAAGLGGVGGVVPSGLPDLEGLAQLANDFFAALPVSSPQTSLPSGLSHLASAAPQASAVLPSSPKPVLGAIAPAQALAPSTPSAALDPSTVTAPVGGAAIGRAQGVPESYAAALPNVVLADPAPHQPASAGGSSYYFLGDAAARPVSEPEIVVPSEDRVTARAFGLPGEDSLRELLGGVALSSGAAPEAEKKNQWFYFTDLRRDEPRPPALGQAGGFAPFDVNAVRRDFPILSERVNGNKPLVWFDNAATTQKPQAVIDRLAYFYAHENSNIHRAAHELAARATDAYENARNIVARFIGAGSAEEIIFVRGATEAINLVAKSWGVQNVEAGDEIIVSHLEHHANIVPWQQLAAEKGATLRVIPVDDSGQIQLDAYRKLLNSRTKIVAVTQVSNALGTVTPIKEIVTLAHSVGAKVLVDGAQSVSHARVNVQALDADFFVFSGHKVFGPTGIGVVYGKRAILEQTQPWQGGGNMIADVTFERTVYNPPPQRFEAGTGNIADAVGLGAALEYVERLGIDNIALYEHGLFEYATHALHAIPGLRPIGTAPGRVSVLSFVLDGYTTAEVGNALSQEGIAVRAGHHCAQPILRRFGVEATVRPSLAFYNTCEEVDKLVAVVHRLAVAKR